MSTVTAVSSNAAAALSRTAPSSSESAPQSGSSPTAATRASASDTVQISAEARAQLAAGKPFFATADAAGASTTEQAAGGKSEAKSKAARFEALQERADAVSARGAGKLERLTKRQLQRADKIGGNVKDEASQKATRGDAQGEKLAGSEERVKGAAADRTELLTEKAKKSGAAVDTDRLDRIGGRVKDEAAQKDTRLGAADSRRLTKEMAVKKRAGLRADRSGVRTEAQTKRVAGSTDKRLNRIEARMKQLDPGKTGGGDEQKIKASASPAGAGEAAQAAEAAAPSKTATL